MGTYQPPPPTPYSLKLHRKCCCPPAYQWVSLFSPPQLFYKNGQPFPAHRPVGLRVHISHVELAVEIPVTQEVLQEPSSNVVKVAFTVRKAGRYEISVKLGGLNVAYSPYYKIFQPGRFFGFFFFLPPSIPSFLFSPLLFK